MSLFQQIYTEETAPEGAGPVLAKVAERLGFVPNIVGKLAESPAAVKGYATLAGILGESSFTPAEQQLLMMTVSRINNCDYCVAAHSTGGLRMGLAEDVIEAVRAGAPIGDPRLNALRDYCAKVVEKRGWTTEDDQKEFLAAGFSKAQILEVILAVGVKTLSNYANHVTEPPLDKPFEAARWSGDKAA